MGYKFINEQKAKPSDASLMFQEPRLPRPRGIIKLQRTQFASFDYPLCILQSSSFQTRTNNACNWNLTVNSLQNPGYNFDELIFCTTMRFHWTLSYYHFLGQKVQYRDDSAFAYTPSYNRMLIDFLWMYGKEMERKRFQDDGDWI